MTKEKVLRILDRHLNKPRNYHFVCYGGSSIRMIDKWSCANTHECTYQGDKNWMTPLCETCKGLTQKEKRLHTPRQFSLESITASVYKCLLSLVLPRMWAL